MQKIKLFNQFALETGSNKNSAIWLAESILARSLGSRFFPNMGFGQKHST